MNLETFQMIQEIIEIDYEKQNIFCSSVVPTKSTIFDYHFPNFPILPGVILTETVAQAAGYLSVLTADFGTAAFFSGIDKVKFREFVFPGDELIIKCERTHQGSGYSAYSGTIHANGKICIEAKFRLREMPFPNEEMKRHLRNYIHNCLNKKKF